MVKTNSQTDVFTDVLISMLAIYGPDLEKVDCLTPALKNSGLTKPEKVAKMSHEDIYSALVQSGYDRGNLLGIFIPRLQAMAQAFLQIGLSKAEEILKSKDIQAIEKILLPIKGIGPKVVKNYLLLRGLADA